MSVLEMKEGTIRALDVLLLRTCTRVGVNSLDPVRCGHNFFPLSEAIATSKEGLCAMSAEPSLYVLFACIVSLET